MVAASGGISVCHLITYTTPVGCDCRRGSAGLIGAKFCLAVADKEGIR